jgi:nucleotide-binding universal stress UspA family protein
MTETTNAPNYASIDPILVPLDGSSGALSALPYAMALATPGTTTLLLTVVRDDEAREPAHAALEQASATLATRSSPPPPVPARA